MSEIFFEEYGVRRRGILKTCPVCHKEFPTRVKNGKTFCSAKCKHDAQTTKIELNCDFCGKKFTRQKSKFEKERASNLQFCTRECKDKAQQHGGILIPSNRTGSFCYREACIREWGNSCAICGWDKFVEAHHIDGNHSNNDLSNLVPLCPNHHRLAHLDEFKEEIDKAIATYSLAR